MTSTATSYSLAAAYRGSLPMPRRPHKTTAGSTEAHHLTAPAATAHGLALPLRRCQTCHAPPDGEFLDELVPRPRPLRAALRIVRILVLWNFGQIPYYQKETGAQSTRTLAVQGGMVPVVEGKSAAHCRWTACLSCCSCPARTMSRRARHLTAPAASYSSWFRVTPAPKGT